MLKTRKAVMVALVFVTVLLTAGVVRAVDEPVDLLAKARWEYSTDSGETFSAAVDVAQSDKTTSIIARTEFDIPEPAAVAYLELTHALQPSQQFALTINDSPVTGPMDGMFYRTIPAIEANILRTGTNVLTASFTASPAQVKVNMSLMALKSEHLAFQTGPLLGAADGESFTVVCRTNMPAEVTLTGKDASASAEQLILRSHGLIHRFRAKWRQDYHYTLTAGKGRIVRTVAIKPRILDPGSSGGRLRFVVMGDSRTNVANWAKVSAAAVRSGPDLIVFGGDMVTYGRDDWHWDNEFFRPAADLFATIPFYPVIGNHEANAPVYFELFYTPGADGRQRNWAQTIGPALLIGIDGADDWSDQSENIRWLTEILAGSKAKFIFLCTHYPAWTSSGHGTLDKEGRPREHALRTSQEVILPLLVRYKATAILAGHDHCYERSEPQAGVTVITTAGAGAPLYGEQPDAARQNPYSKVFASKLHYCLFDIQGDSCRMTALTPTGEVIDERTWNARN